MAPPPCSLRHRGGAPRPACGTTSRDVRPNASTQARGEAARAPPPWLSRGARAGAEALEVDDEWADLPSSSGRTHVPEKAPLLDAVLKRGRQLGDIPLHVPGHKAGPTQGSARGQPGERVH
jgi:hypothetical protein